MSDARLAYVAHAPLAHGLIYSFTRRPVAPEPEITFPSVNHLCPPSPFGRIEVDFEGNWREGPVSKTSYPSWEAFRSFEKAFEESLERIAAMRRGGRVVEELKSTSDDVPHELRVVVKAASDYSPEICRLINETSSLVALGEVGRWIQVNRTAKLDSVVSALRRKCDQAFKTPKVSAGMDTWHALRTAKIQERDLRFFGDFAVICGRIHWQRWVACSDSRSKLAACEKANRLLTKTLTKLLGDRYVHRRMSDQDLAAISALQGLLKGVQTSFDFVAAAPQLPPYKRYHPDGRGDRAEIAAEIVHLCRLCFGQCQRRVLEALLEEAEIPLPSRLDDWITDQLKEGDALVEAYETAQNGINALLPPASVDDVRRPCGTLPPWLQTDVSQLKIIGFSGG